MLPDTSIARMIVSCSDGSVTIAAGRAIATSISAQRREKQQRRHMAAEAAGRRPCASLTMLKARVAQRMLAACAAAAGHRAPTSTGSDSSSHSISGQRNVIGHACSMPEVRRQAAAGRKLAAPLAQIGEAQDRVDEIVVGGRARARRRRRRRAPRAARARALLGNAAKRLRKPRSCVSTNSCSPVSASCDHQEAEVGQLHLQRVVEAHRDHVVALREMRERLLPSRAR